MTTETNNELTTRLDHLRDDLVSGAPTPTPDARMLTLLGRSPRDSGEVASAPEIAVELEVPAELEVPTGLEIPAEVASLSEHRKRTRARFAVAAVAASLVLVVTGAIAVSGRGSEGELRAEGTGAPSSGLTAGDTGTETPAPDDTQRSGGSDPASSTDDDPGSGPHPGSDDLIESQVDWARCMTTMFDSIVDGGEVPMSELEAECGNLPFRVLPDVGYPFPAPGGCDGDEACRLPPLADVSELRQCLADEDVLSCMDRFLNIGRPDLFACDDAEGPCAGLDVPALIECLESDEGCTFSNFSFPWPGVQRCAGDDCEPGQVPQVENCAEGEPGRRCWVITFDNTNTAVTRLEIGPYLHSE